MTDLEKSVLKEEHKSKKIQTHIVNVNKILCN